MSTATAAAELRKHSKKLVKLQEKWPEILGFNYEGEACNASRDSEGEKEQLQPKFELFQKSSNLLSNDGPVIAFRRGFTLFVLLWLTARRGLRGLDIIGENGGVEQDGDPGRMRPIEAVSVVGSRKYSFTDIFNSRPPWMFIISSLSRACVSSEQYQTRKRSSSFCLNKLFSAMLKVSQSWVEHFKLRLSSKAQIDTEFEKFQSGNTNYIFSMK